jgi:hypothetical protein
MKTSQASPIPEHDCREHMVPKSSRHTETHGFDCGPFERFEDHWWECSICGVTEEDLKRN